MTLQDQNFTISQFNEIYKFLQWVNLCNNELGSNCSIDSLRIYKDKYGNFYASYFLNNFTQDGSLYSIGYIQINKEGERINLAKRYDNSGDIAMKLAKYDEIKLA
jgi:hypothetical protein